MHACSPADAKARADVQARDRPRPAIDQLAEPQPSSTFQLQPVTAAITTAMDASSDSSSDRSDSATPNPHKRRRLGEPASVASTATQIAASHDGLETWKRKAAEREEEVEVVKSQKAALRTENESLKSEIERLKRCEESLIAAVLAATRRP
jgi:predicted  nucleic acid-binding Zn-ribbon protein